MFGCGIIRSVNETGAFLTSSSIKLIRRWRGPGQRLSTPNLPARGRKKGMGTPKNAPPSAKEGKTGSKQR
jgi:hypothetical protein